MSREEQLPRTVRWKMSGRWLDRVNLPIICHDCLACDATSLGMRRVDHELGRSPWRIGTLPSRLWG